MVFSNEDKILIKSLYLKGYKAKWLTDEFPEKSWTTLGVKKLLKKLRDTGTVDRRTGIGRPRSVCTEDKNSSGDEIANVNFYAVRPEATEFAEITQNNADFKSYWNSAGQLNIQHDVVAYSAATPLSVVTK